MYFPWYNRLAQHYKNSQACTKKAAEYSTSWQISLTVPRFVLDLFELALEPIVDALSTQLLPEGWLIRGYTGAEPSQSKIATILERTATMAGMQPPFLTIQALPELNWARESIRNLNPVHVGRFVIRGSHSAACKNPARIELEIDAGAAFGTAHHATTKGCLLALSKLAPALAPSRPLDIGCGAGTLAMAIARLWKVKVVACDIDPIAVRVARRNATLNYLHRLVRCLVSDGFASPLIRERGPFDLIVANILQRPLGALSPSIVLNSVPGATVVLSGLLDSQASSIVATYRGQGLHLRNRFSIDGWTTLIMVRPQ